MMTRQWILPLIASVLLLSAIACGRSNSAELVDHAGDDRTDEARASESHTQPHDPVGTPADPASLHVFQLGDWINLEDHALRLNAVSYQGTVLVANFTFSNEGSSDLNVSPLFSMSARLPDGTRLEHVLFDCSDTDLDGTVLPGERLTGDVCWSSANPGAGLQIYYDPGIFTQGAVVWDAVEGETAADGTGGFNPAAQIYSVGDTLAFTDHTLRINSIDYRGSILEANLTITHTGTGTFPVGSFVSFNARREDGTRLERELFDCTPGGIDTRLLPNDFVTGSLCWLGASPDDNIRLYYESNTFAEGAIVFDAVEGNAGKPDVQPLQLVAEMHSPGQTITVRSHTVVLNSITPQNGYTEANFTVENLGNSDLEITPLLQFWAKNPQGEILQKELFYCSSSLNGTVFPGTILTGNVCWQSADSRQPFRIYYQNGLGSQTIIVWEVTP